MIVTAGTISARLPSPFPREIPIGAVKRIEGEGELDRTIHVKPYADLRVPRLRAGADHSRRPTCAPRHTP